MAFDLSQLDDEHTRWVRIGLGDMEVEVRHVGPQDQERFRQKMIRDGVIRKGEGIDFMPGRFGSFCEAFAAQYVTGWRNLILNGVKDPPYAAPEMGKILTKCNSAMVAIGDALKAEADFFSQNGDGSPG